MKTKSNSALGTVSIAFGVLACLGCWIPFLNMISLIMAIFGVFFGVIGFIIALFGGKVARPIAGVFISGVAIFIIIVINAAAAEAISKTQP